MDKRKKNYRFVKLLILFRALTHFKVKTLNVTHRQMSSVCSVIYMVNPRSE